MSVETNFVSMYEGLCSDLILHIVVILFLTSCCMKRYRSSMCFAFFDVPSLMAIDLAELLSVCILTLVFVSKASLTKLLM